MYNSIPSEADACLYMEVEGQEDIQLVPDTGDATKTEIKASNIAR